MALTRKFLSALGIEADKIDEIISAHRETVDGLKEEVDNQKNEVEKLKEESKDYSKVKADYEASQKALKELQENKDITTLETKYNALKSEYDAYKLDVENKAIRAKKESAYKELLKDAKIPEKRFESIIKLSGDSIDKIELDDSGELKNKDDIVDSINNDWSEYAQVIEEQGASTPKPPANNGGSDKKISRAKQIAQQYHEDMYGKIKED